MFDDRPDDWANPDGVPGKIIKFGFKNCVGWYTEAIYSFLYEKLSDPHCGSKPSDENRLKIRPDYANIPAYNQKTLYLTILWLIRTSSCGDILNPVTAPYSFVLQNYAKIGKTENYPGE